VLSVVILFIILTGELDEQPVLMPVPEHDEATEQLIGHRVVLSIDDGHRSVYEKVYPLLKKYNMTATLAIIVNSLFNDNAGYLRRGRGYYINYEEIKEMVDSCNVEIASHSLSHPWLTRLDSARLWQEVYRSRLILESLFGIPVLTFVYPYGAMDARVRRFVERAGYRLGRAVRPGAVNLWVDPYRLPVFELRQGTGLEAVKNHIRNHKISSILLHRVVEKPAVFTEWSVDDLAALLAWLDRCGLKTVTLSEIYYEWRQQVINRIILEWRDGRGVFSPESLLQDIHIDATRAFQPR